MTTKRTITDGRVVNIIEAEITLHPVCAWPRGNYTTCVTIGMCLLFLVTDVSRLVSLLPLVKIGAPLFLYLAS